MQILYLAIEGSSSGVRKKLKDKIDFIRSEGCNIDLVCVTSSQLAQLQVDYKRIIVNDSFSRFFGKKRILWRVSVFVEQWEFYQAILKYLRNREFDLILFRYPGADFFLWIFSIVYGQRVVFEHNSIELEELRLRKSESFWYRYFYYSEKWFGSIVRKYVRGFIGVTNEITQWQTSLSKGNHLHTTISNGINVDRVNLRVGKPFDGSILNLLFLAGSEAPWHGVDKLIRSINLYNGKVEIHCFITGSISEENRIAAKGNSRITVLPTQQDKQLDDLIDKCHLGVGPLGMASFLREACPLKTREYWSRGLPFVIGYNDVDLVGREEMKAFYYFPKNYTDSHFDLEEVIQFADSVYRDPAVSVKMRAFAMSHIHYKTKAEQYVSFLNLLRT
ncbi:MAG: hypothetical protein R2820_08835 [Cyclobacteriaceae bacterium]|nr:hypothetical protein [Cyclobacteriaceae bacterium]